MNEYQLEIANLKRTLEKARIDEAAPEIIEEYAAELRNLAALFEASKTVFEAGESESVIPRALDLVGYGDWTFDNVYSYVYDAAISEELDGRELSSIVNATDYAASLRAIFD